MSMCCLKCGSEYAGRDLPCKLCGSVLFAPNSREQRVVHFGTGATNVGRAAVTIADVAVSATANAPPPRLAARPVEIAMRAPAASTLRSVDKKTVLVTGGVFALLITLFVGSQYFKLKTPQQSPSNSQSPVSVAPAPNPAYSAGSPSTLEPRWLGTWKTLDGKKTMEISAQKITILTDEWKRVPDDQTVRMDLTWTTNRDLKEGEFGYAGKNTSPAAITRSYEKNLAEFKKGSPDFGVSPPDAATGGKWIAWLAPRDYQVLQGYGGGDGLPTEWIADENGNMLEVNAGHYGFHLRLLQRTPAKTPNNTNSSSRFIADAESGGAVLAPTARVGDTYTYETLDQIEPKLNNVTTREVVDVNSNGFVMAFVNAKSKYTRRLFYDNNLNLTASRSGDNDGMNYSPSLQYFKFPMKSGDTWNSSSTETNIKTGKTRTHTLRGSIGELEQVIVPSGTFRAFRVTIQSELNDEGQISTGQDISWYSPDVRRTVMSELESRDPTGKIGRRRVSLISYRLQ